jgi:uncharacterized protein
MLIKALSRPECVVILSRNRLARLACSRNEQPYIVPVYYAFDDRHLYSFAMPGQKVEFMRANPLICFEIEEARENREWSSVVVNGIYEELTGSPQHEQERGHAWSLLSQHTNWWEPGALKLESAVSENVSRHLFYRIRMEAISGRQAVDDSIGK